MMLRAIVVGWLLAVAVPVEAQEPFRSAYAQAEAVRAGGNADAAQVRRSFATALEEYLRMEQELQRDADWLPYGAFSALLAEDFALASDLFVESLRAGNWDEINAENLLRAQLGAHRFEEMLRWARDLEPTFSEAVWRVLVDSGGLVESEAWKIAGRWLAAGESEAALWVFRYFVEASGEHPDSLANLALSLRSVGQETECEQTYRRALAKVPDDGRIWNDYGLFLKGSGRLDEAASAFRRSRDLEGDPASGPATSNLVLLGLKTGRHSLEDPVGDLAVVLRERPEAALARRSFLRILAARNRAFRVSEPDTKPLHR